MSDYINKEDALDVFESIIHSLNENRFKSPSGLLTELYGKIHGVGLCRDIIRNAPTIDAEPVVRCKDCKWFDKQRCVCHNPRYGDGYANYQPPNTNDEYWCADGERKDNED